MTLTFDNVSRPEVGPECRVFRVVRPDCLKEDPEAPPKSAAFTDSTNRPERPDQCISLYLEDRIRTASRRPSELLALFKPGSRLCWVTVQELEKDLEQELLDVPDDEFFPGHVVAHDPNKPRRSQPTMSKWAQLARWYYPEAEERSAVTAP